MRDAWAEVRDAGAGAYHCDWERHPHLSSILALGPKADDAEAKFADLQAYPPVGIAAFLRPRLVAQRVHGEQDAVPVLDGRRVLALHT